MTEDIKQVHDFLHRVRNNAARNGVFLNADKTDFMCFNQKQETVLSSINNDNIKKVGDFKYLGGWIDNTENDVNVRKVLAWKHCNN